MFSFRISCLLAAIFSCGTALTTFSVSVNSSCPSYQTPCALGCCPYADGVCCADGFECCQHGQTCIPVIGLCIGLKNENGETSLVSVKSTPLENSITACPPNMTECGPRRCCRYSNATCCSDGLHCCPEGYRCDLEQMECVKDSFNNLASDWSSRSGLAQVSPAKTTPKPQVKTCPGSERVCPSYTSCCINDNSEWSCCPNPSLPQLSYGIGECCGTVYGFLCCPDSLPHCTRIGCVA